MFASIETSDVHTAMAVKCCQMLGVCGFKLAKMNSIVSRMMRFLLVFAKISLIKCDVGLKLSQ